LYAWRDGDAGAAEVLFERYFEGLYRFFQYKAPEACDDLVQATFLGCVEGATRFRGESTFRTYLFSVARHQLLSWIAKQRHQRLLDPEPSNAPDPSTSPSTVFHRQTEQRLVVAALRRLPIEGQILLELFYWEKLSGRELATVLGVPEGTIRTRVRRAREQLRQAVLAIEAQPSLAKPTATNLDGWAASLRKAHPRVSS